MIDTAFRRDTDIIEQKKAYIQSLLRNG